MEQFLSLDYDWLHSEIVYDSPPRLYQLALVKTTASFHFEEPEFYECNQPLIELLPKLSSLMVPKTMQNDLSQMTELVWYELCELYDMLSYEFSNDSNDESWTLLIKKTHWTWQGMIDKRKTAEALANASDLDIGTRFLIAKLFCLTDHINSLSIQRPPDYFKYYANMYVNISEMYDVSIAKEHLNIPEVEIDYKSCFRRNINRENKNAAHYYWQRLTDQDKLSVLESQLSESFGWDDAQSNNMWFLFHHFDKEMQIQLLQDERFVYAILRELLEFQWLSIFETCIKYCLKHLTTNCVVHLLAACVKYVTFSIALKKEYIRHCALLLKHLCKECPLTTVDAFTNDLLIRALHTLSREGEIKHVKDFLQFVNCEWIKMQFTRSNVLAVFVIVSLKCKMIETVFDCGFSSVSKRKKFLCGEEFMDIIEQLFWHVDQMDDITKIISSLFLKYKEIKSFKIKFVEKNSFINLCFNLFKCGKYDFVDSFVQWCFNSKEERIYDFKKKFAEKRGCDLCFRLFMEGMTDTVNSFVQWCFESEEKAIYSFKMKFAGKTGLGLCFGFFMLEDWRDVDEFIHWCFALDEKKIFSFKRKFAEKKGRKLFFKLLMREKWDVLDKVAEWCYASNSDLLISSRGKFAEEYGYYSCFKLLVQRKWKTVDKLVQWCYVSEELITVFYNKFFRSEQFARLFHFNYLEIRSYASGSNLLEESTEAVISLIRMISVKSRIFSPELMSDACLKILSKCYFSCHCLPNGSKFLFETMDRVFLAFIDDDQNLLTDLKKELFTDKSSKLFISLPLKFLPHKIRKAERDSLWPTNKKIKDELLLLKEITDDFFAWICSSDEALKSEMEEEFWNSDKVSEVKKNLRNKKKRALEY